MDLDLVGHSHLSHRQRATLTSLAGLGATPFIVLHARATFQPYIFKGSYTAAVAWIALAAIYYVTARTALDVCRDCFDWFSGTYIVCGGDYDVINQGRKKTPPYDLLSIPNAQRDLSNWQYSIVSWVFLEIIVAWIAFAGMFYVLFHSPYLSSLSHSGQGTGHDTPSNALAWFMLKMSTFLIVFSLYSIAYRWDLGLTPLVQRLLGAPDFYPGQNKFPRWVNELSIRLFGRPM